MQLINELADYTIANGNTNFREQSASWEAASASARLEMEIEGLLSS